MSQRRILILDEDAVVMVVGGEVIHKVDEHRGEMTRSEFINFLIQSQLKEGDRNRNYVDKEEFHRFAQETKGVIRNLLELFLGWAMELDQKNQNNGFDEWVQKIRALEIPEAEEKDES